MFIFQHHGAIQLELLDVSTEPFDGVDQPVAAFPAVHVHKRAHACVHPCMRASTRNAHICVHACVYQLACVHARVHIRISAGVRVCVCARSAPPVERGLVCAGLLAGAGLLVGAGSGGLPVLSRAWPCAHVRMHTCVYMCMCQRAGWPERWRVGGPELSLELSSATPTGMGLAGLEGQHYRTALPHSTGVQHRHTAQAYNTGVKHRRTAQAYSTPVQHMRTAQAFSTCAQHRRTAHRYSTCIQHMCTA